MSYNATVFTVMIASPGDVASERATVRQVIHEWNTIHSITREIVLLPAGWETHTSPEMGAPPQEIINEQLLDKCDLLVGVFWTRIGTKTQEHSSGTVEEIEKHLVADRPAMLYFSSQPAHPDSIDPEQFAELNKFKESCKSRGLLENYESQSEFREKFYRQLQIKLNEHSLFQKEQVSTAVFHDSLTIRDGLQVIDSQSLVGSYRTILSDKARVLLKKASEGSGTIMYLRVMRGPVLQINKQNLLEGVDKRTAAAWESALEELAREDLIKDRGHKGEVFEVTHSGYQMADEIEL